MGGLARASQLGNVVTQYALQRALDQGTVIRPSRGLYCLPERLSRARVHALRGVVSHLSAAEIWELGVLTAPTMLHVTVRRHRSRVDCPDDVDLHYADLQPDEIRAEVTTVLRTVLDCAKTCQFPQALAIADTALRVGHITKQELVDAASALRGKGSARARRVAKHADSRAMSPAESALRGILIEGNITVFEPQFRATRNGRWIATVDLGDPATGIMLEADSFFWHGQRSGLERDARRYNELVVAGYLVLRFTWEHIVGDPEWVLSMVLQLLAQRGRSANQQERRLAA